MARKRVEALIFSDPPSFLALLLSLSYRIIHTPIYFLI